MYHIISVDAKKQMYITKRNFMLNQIPKQFTEVQSTAVVCHCFFLYHIAHISGTVYVKTQLEVRSDQFIGKFSENNVI